MKHIIFAFFLVISFATQAAVIDERYEEVCVCADPYQNGRLVPALVRDFKASHPDFEYFTGNEANRNIVTENLGGDGRPVYRIATDALPVEKRILISGIEMCPV